MAKVKLEANRTYNALRYIEIPTYKGDGRILRFMSFPKGFTRYGDRTRAERWTMNYPIDKTYLKIFTCYVSYLEYLTGPVGHRYHTPIIATGCISPGNKKCIAISMTYYGNADSHAMTTIGRLTKVIVEYLKIRKLSYTVSDISVQPMATNYREKRPEHFVRKSRSKYE